MSFGSGTVANIWWYSSVTYSWRQKGVLEFLASHLGSEKGRPRPRRFPRQTVEVVVRAARLVEHLGHHGGQQGPEGADGPAASPSRLGERAREEKDIERGSMAEFDRTVA